MSFIRTVDVTLTTNSSGAATGYTPPVNGFLLKASYIKVDFADGIDFTITAETNALPILARTDQNTAAIFNPREATHDVLGAASLYAAAGEPVEGLIPLANERIKVVVAQGGDTKTGTFRFWVG